MREEKALRVGSLFSGGGLGDFGLELAGFEIAFQVEIEEYCQKVLALRWPDVPKWRDIREVTGKELIQRAGPIDVLAGGFPCQDISTAGRGAGIGGARSGLWKEMFRIIREIRPRYVLVENVTALLGRGLGVVLGDLAEIGYDAEWDCIPASAIGAPHQRDRVWIVAYAAGDGVGRGSGEFRKTHGRSDGKMRWKSLGASEKSEDVADTESASARRLSERKKSKKSEPRINGEACDSTSERLQNGSAKTIFGSQAHKELERSNWWAVEPDVGRVAHGIANRVDRLKLLGNGQVVQVVRFIGERILAFNRRIK